MEGPQPTEEIKMEPTMALHWHQFELQRAKPALFGGQPILGVPPPIESKQHSQLEQAWIGENAAGETVIEWRPIPVHRTGPKMMQTKGGIIA